MHTYTLTIAKDDFLLEFKSTDKHIVQKELGVWITAAAELLDAMEPYVPPVEPLQPEKIELGQIIVERPRAQHQEQSRVVVQEPPQVQVVPQVQEFIPRKAEPQEQDEIANVPAPEPIPTVAVEQKTHQHRISDETKAILQKAIHKPKPSMNEVLAEKQIREYKPTQISMPKKQTVQEIDKFPPIQPPTPPVVAQVPVVEPIQEDFTTAYNQKVVQDNNSTDKFAQLLSLQNIHSKFDCLLACAYHLVERENFERFTLKQVNTLSKALMEEAIEHDTLKDALERRFIKIVPDYTGIATTMEYTLTDQGIRYFEREIAG